MKTIEDTPLQLSGVFAVHLRCSQRKAFIERVFRAAEVMLYRLDVKRDQWGWTLCWHPVDNLLSFSYISTEPETLEETLYQAARCFNITKGLNFSE